MRTPSLPTLANAAAPARLADVLELAELEAATWTARRAGIPAWHPRAEDEPPADADAPKGDDDGKDDADAKGKGDDAAGDAAGDADDDDDDEDEGKGRDAAIARYRREAKEAKDALAKRERTDAEAGGKWKDLYEKAVAELEDVKSKSETEAVARLIAGAAGKAKAHNADEVARLIDLEDVETEADAERAVKRLAKKSPHLFQKDGPRTVRKDTASTSDDDDTPAPKTASRSRLSKGVAAAIGGGGK